MLEDRKRKLEQKVKMLESSLKVAKNTNSLLDKEVTASNSTNGEHALSWME